MQTVSDIFLGYLADQGREYYTRQLKDWKGSADFEKASEPGLLGRSARLDAGPCPRTNGRRDRGLPR